MSCPHGMSSEVWCKLCKCEMEVHGTRTNEPKPTVVRVPTPSLEDGLTMRVMDHMGRKLVWRVVASVYSALKCPICGSSVTKGDRLYAVNSDTTIVKPGDPFQTCITNKVTTLICQHCKDSTLTWYATEKSRKGL